MNSNILIMKHLYIVLLFLLPVACNNRLVEIYPMSNIWEIYGEHKHEYYVLYNTRWKSRQEIENAMLEFNRNTISIDTILKYKESYWRRFYVKTRILTKDYNYEKEGYDAIRDHAKSRYMDMEWRKCKDSLICVLCVSLLHRKEQLYKLSAENIDSIMNPVFTEDDARPNRK